MNGGNDLGILPRSAQLFAVDYRAPIKQTAAVAFFTSYPRNGAPSVLTIEADYFLGLVRLSLPWIITGCFLGVMAIAAILTRFCCLRRPIRRARRFWREGQGLVRLTSILTSLLVSTATLISVASAMISIHTVRQTSTQSLDLFNYTGTSVEAVVGVVSTSVLAISDILEDGKELIPAEVEPTFDQLVDAINQQLTTVQSALSQVDGYISTLRDIIDRGATISRTVFLVTFVLLIIIALATVIGKFVESRRSSAQICFLLLLIVPMIFAWLLTGIAASVGVGVGDSCVVVKDFQLGILESADLFRPSTPIPSNPLIDSDVRCAKDLIGGPNDLFNIRSLIQLVRSLEGIIGTIAAIQGNVSGSQRVSLLAVVDVLQNMVDELLACRYTVGIASRLDHYICGDYIASVASAVRSLFASLIALAILTTVIFVMSLSGMPIAAYADVWYNAFGDAESDGQYTDFDPDEQNPSPKEVPARPYTGQYNVQGSVAQPSTGQGG